MTERIDPLRPVRGERRRAARRQGDPAPAAAAAPAGAGLPMVIEGSKAAPPPEPTREAGSVILAAQLMGQTGQKRGLRGGPPVLNAARSAYLEAEWSGPKDRRPRAGASTKTEI